MVRCGGWMNRNQTKNEKPWPYAGSDDLWRTSKKHRKTSKNQGHAVRCRISGFTMVYQITRSFPCNFTKWLGPWAVGSPSLCSLVSPSQSACWWAGTGGGAYWLNPLHQNSVSRHRIDWSAGPGLPELQMELEFILEFLPQRLKREKKTFDRWVQLRLPVTADYAKPKHWQHLPRSTSNSVIQCFWATSALLISASHAKLLDTGTVLCLRFHGLYLVAGRMLSLPKR